MEFTFAHCFEPYNYYLFSHMKVLSRQPPTREDMGQLSYMTKSVQYSAQHITATTLLEIRDAGEGGKENKTGARHLYKKE